MTLFSPQELKALIENPEGTCVSIYMPAHRIGTATQQDPIRFKNLMKQAEEELISQGMRSQDARDFLKRAQELDRDEFWQHQSDGLAILISENLFQYYCLPLNFDELVVVSDRFHLKPLMPLLTGNGRFYILALSQNQVRLLQGTQYSVSEIELEDMPTNIAEALKYDDPEKQVRFHGTTPQRGSGKSNTRTAGDHAAMFHGQGAGKDDRKTDILRYFRQVNGGLEELFQGEYAPLVLAGVEYLFPIYKEANTYPHLIEGGVTGNADEIKPEELHEQAWKVVEPYFQQHQEAATSRYHELAGTGQTANNLPEVVKAACYKRIDALFVPVGVQEWGVFDAEKDKVETHSEKQMGDDDLMDIAAIHTFLNQGTVYAVEPEQLPDDAPLAAVFRY